MHVRGPQGLIDERLRIADSDILIGVFWKRFGTPVSDASSGTEHEIRRAIAAWRAKGAPQVMLYFRDTPHQPASPEEEEQFQKVQKFKQDLLSTDKPFVWEYGDVASFFSKSLLIHLLQMVMEQLKPQASPVAPYLRVSASANCVCVREEGAAELMGDLFLRCTNDSDAPSPGYVPATVALTVSAPIATDVVLFEVGRPGALTGAVPGVIGPPGSNELTFRTHLSGIGPHETRILQVSNPRCMAPAQAVYVYARITGASIENGVQKVATGRNGLDFEVRTAIIPTGSPIADS